MENLVDKAIAFALQAHKGQLDKGGNAYILHPLRIASRFTDSSLQIIAILHDVIEDSQITTSDLSIAGFPDEIIKALVTLTKNKDETYDEFIDRISLNKIAIKIKLADLEDNMNVTRIQDLKEEDLIRLNKYKKAYVRLNQINSAANSS